MSGPKTLMTTLIYSNQKTDFTKGLRYANPRFFDGNCKDGIIKVIVVGSWPNVEKAYRAAGAEVVTCELNGVLAAAAKIAPAPAPEAPVTKSPPAKVAPASRVVAFNVSPNPPQATVEIEAPVAAAVVTIPDDWQLQPWAVMRGVAVAVAGRPVINKEEARQVIQAELTRRAQAAKAPQQ